MSTNPLDRHESIIHGAATRSLFRAGSGSYSVGTGTPFALSVYSFNTEIAGEEDETGASHRRTVQFVVSTADLVAGSVTEPQPRQHYITFNSVVYMVSGAVKFGGTTTINAVEIENIDYLADAQDRRRSRGR